MSELMSSVTPQRLTELLQEAGYRVNQSEQNGIVQLLSASQGIGFAVRFGNPAAEQGAYVDFTYSCALRVQGELPAGLAPVWNTSRRFARLSVQGEFLLMEMDVMVAGVGALYLRSQLELWDRLLQEFIVYLREYSQTAAHLHAQAALALLGVAVGLGLRSGSDPVAAQQPAPVIGAEGPAVARLGNQQVAVPELQALLATLPAESREQLRANRGALETWIRSRLAQKAVLEQADAQGWRQRPDVEQQTRAATEQIVFRDYLLSVSQVPADYPSAAELQQAYDSGKAQWMTPPLYR
eukprot:gene19347-19236_t